MKKFYPQIDRIIIHQKYAWMEKSYSWIKVSSMEKMMDNFFICGCHPWMKINNDTNDAHGHSQYHMLNTSYTVVNNFHQI